MPSSASTPDMRSAQAPPDWPALDDSFLDPVPLRRPPTSFDVFGLFTESWTNEPSILGSSLLNNSLEVPRALETSLSINAGSSSPTMDELSAWLH
jgi:hypothetical protein